MNVEQKILLTAFGVYTLLTIVLVFKSPTQHFPESIPFLQKDLADSIIFDTYYKGTWSGNENTSKFLSKKNGNAYANFIKLQSVNFDDQLDIKLDSSVYLLIYLYDPQYKDERFLRILEPLVYDNIANISLKNTTDGMRIGSNMVYFENFNEYISVFNMSFQGTVGFANQTFSDLAINTTAFQNTENILNIHIYDDSPDGLNFHFNFSKNPENRAKTSFLYAYFMVAIALMNYLGALSLFGSIFEDLNFTKRINKTTITIVCLQDCFIFLYNIQIGFNFLDTWNFVVVVVWYFVLFCFVDYRLLLYVWRYQNNREFDELTEHQFRNKLYAFQMKIYFLILIYLYFMWRYFIDVHLVLLNSLVLVPQIIHHIQSAEPPGFNKSFLILFSSSKYLIFMYLRGCPNNILQIRPFFLIPFIGLSIIIASLFILYHQENYGSRGFLPKILKGSQYEYWIEMTEFSKTNCKDQENLNVTKEEITCCICLGSLLAEETSHAKDDKNQKNLKSKALNRILEDKGQKYLMKTPCSHIFHADCLIRWMDIQMKCPHCRSDLPNII